MIPQPPPPIRRVTPAEEPEERPYQRGDENQPVSREIYNSLKALKEELEKNDGEMRNVIADLQGQLIQSRDESNKLRQALGQARDDAQRNGDLADARDRNFKQCERSLQDRVKDHADLKQRYALLDENRREKMAKVEELQMKLLDGGDCELANERVAQCRFELTNVTGRVKELQDNMSHTMQMVIDKEKDGEEERKALKICEARMEAASRETAGLKDMFVKPLERLTGQLQAAEESVRERDRRLVDQCLTKEAQALETAFSLLLVPFGVALVGLPAVARGGGLRSRLTSVANSLDVVVLFFWILTAVYLSYRKEVDEAVASIGTLGALEDLEPHIKLLLELRAQVTEFHLHVVGGVMYGFVVGLHLLALFASPDVLGTMQGFAFWGIGMHYYATLDSASFPPIKGDKSLAMTACLISIWH